MNKKYRASSWDSNINLIVYVSILFSALGMAWLSLNDVPSGTRYTLIFLISVAILFLTFFFLNENQKSTFGKLVKSPFTTDLHVAGGLYLLGWIVPVILQTVMGFFTKSFNIAQVMIPLSAEKVLTDVSQSFSVAQAQASPFWNWFITVFTAGNIEEFAFGFVLVLVLYVSAMLFWRLAFGDKESHLPVAKNFYTIFALVGSALVFGGVHQLNSTYVGYMFIVAIIFRLIMNASIYKFGLFLTFTLGYHQSNNAIWFFKEYGAQATFDALGSWGGLGIVIYFLLIIIFVFRNIDVVVKKLKDVFSFGG